MTITSHADTLSPPTLDTGTGPLSHDAASHYRPEHDVVRLPDAEVMIPRGPEGFGDDEVAHIISTITLG